MFCVVTHARGPFFVALCACHRSLSTFSHPEKLTRPQVRQTIGTHMGQARKTKSYIVKVLLIVIDVGRST